MKKQVLLISSTLVCLAGSMAAQPTLTATGINPVVGDSWFTVDGNYVNPGNTGANETWDLSTIGTGPATTNSMIAPSSTPNGSSFPASNVCSGGSGSYLYEITSATAQQGAGEATVLGVVAYSDLEDYMRFPFNYNDAYVDTFTATWMYNGYVTDRFGTITVEADGYGTLITPAGTFNNVMRVHSHEWLRDSAIAGSYWVEYDVDSYDWFVDGNHAPLASVYIYSVNGSPIDGAYYQTFPAGGIDMNSANSALFSTFPSPAVNEVTVKVNNIQPQTIELTDISGRVVAVSDPAGIASGKDTYMLDVSAYPTGIYFIRIVNAEGTVATRKIAITR